MSGIRIGTNRQLGTAPVLAGNWRCPAAYLEEGEVLSTSHFGLEARRGVETYPRRAAVVVDLLNHMRRGIAYAVWSQAMVCGLTTAQHHTQAALPSRCGYLVRKTGWEPSATTDIV